MKLAALDIGSNSIHLVVVDVSGSGALTVVGRDRVMVRLGARTFGRGRLTPTAMQRGVEAIAALRRVAENHGVEEILAVATAAIREAENGETFLARVGEQAGVWPRLVTGDQEARLIHLAA